MAEKFEQGDYCTHLAFGGVVLVYRWPEEEEYLPDEPPEHLCGGGVDEFETCRFCEAWGSDPEDWATRYTGQAVVRMVGDDRNYVVDPEDLVKFEDSVCSCGQVGCGWH